MGALAEERRLSVGIAAEPVIQYTITRTGEEKELSKTKQVATR